VLGPTADSRPAWAGSMWLCRCVRRRCLRSPYRWGEMRCLCRARGSSRWWWSWSSCVMARRWVWRATGRLLMLWWCCGRCVRSMGWRWSRGSLWLLCCLCRLARTQARLRCRVGVLILGGGSRPGRKRLGSRSLRLVLVSLGVWVPARASCRCGSRNFLRRP
jgi:hypothetical protein